MAPQVVMGAAVRHASLASTTVVRRDRRRRRSQIEQNSRLRQKRNFNYIVDSVLDGNLAEVVASRLAPTRAEALAQQLRRCVMMFRVHARQVMENGRVTEILPPDESLVLRKNAMVEAAKELAEQMPLQVLPRIVNSRCYTFFRAAFDSGTSDGRKKFRWDVEEEFAGLDLGLLRLWNDVIVTHYLAAYLRDTPDCAHLLARIEAAAAIKPNDTTPTPPSRTLTERRGSSSAHAPSSAYEGLAHHPPAPLHLSSGLAPRNRDEQHLPMPSRPSPPAVCFANPPPRSATPPLVWASAVAADDNVYVHPSLGRLTGARVLAAPPPPDRRAFAFAADLACGRSNDDVLSWLAGAAPGTNGRLQDILN